MADILSTAAEAQQLALTVMAQKSLADDSPEDIAREYRDLQKRIQAALEANA